jgi:hypothetical protein
MVSVLETTLMREIGRATDVRSVRSPASDAVSVRDVDTT